MKLIIHKTKGCSLCDKCLRLLATWAIQYNEVYDEPKQDRPYPYITIELEYKQLVNWVAKGKLDWSD